MSLHPILALDHVLEEYSSYLRTEFRAKDPELKRALERELDRPLFLAQEPFYQAHRPFKPGKRWRELPLDARLASVMEERARQFSAVHPDHAFTHQSQAIELLLTVEPRPVVVTTGTGSGKSEAFLLPVIQNAIEDASRFPRSGLTALLVYPMNALANDQQLRIEQYLQQSGFAGTVTVASYNRGTAEQDRRRLRDNPPHILLTNYMMLEYLLVRPTDRESIFANHRCKYLVLDEVHTYRGALGANIALLVRRFRAHLARARQDWNTEVASELQFKRFPRLVSVGTSATIKSIAANAVDPDEARRLRDQDVQRFFSKLTGETTDSICVIGEEIEDIQVPDEAAYPAMPSTVALVNVSDLNEVRSALTVLAGVSADTAIEAASKRCKVLWDLNRLLVRSPMSVSQIAQTIRQEVPERHDLAPEVLRSEIEAALIIGAALPDGTPGALRLRAHRFIRGGWRFHRCIDPACGRLYPMGETECQCGSVTAPLFLCRNCGADYLRFTGDPANSPLEPGVVPNDELEWMLFEHGRFDSLVGDDEDDAADGTDGRAPRRRAGQAVPAQIRRRQILRGSFDPQTRQFSTNDNDYRIRVLLVPGRTRCMCCGGSAGSRSVITPVSLGTSAALKVMSEGILEALHEAKAGTPAADDKERLLVFSDSRQDAAHQARFIIFASRYDRLRRNLVQLLRENERLSIQRAVELLSDRGARDHDNPYAPTDDHPWIDNDTREKMHAWEEAPLLDEIAVNAGYRNTVINIGVVGIQYEGLNDYVQSNGLPLADSLRIDLAALHHICRCILDEIRIRGCVSRPMLCYHADHPACPAYVRSALWERRVKQPQGFACTEGGDVVAYLDRTTLPPGIRNHNPWRSPQGRGRGPSAQRILQHLLSRFGGIDPDEDLMRSLLEFLKHRRLLVSSELFGTRDRRSLLQVNAGAILFGRLSEVDRRRCDVCGQALAYAIPGSPCPRCHGSAVVWTEPEILSDRSVARLYREWTIPLVAGEHTAQVTTVDRVELERQFKAPSDQSRTNLLACSPTLELGIDVGGLDAVALRNIPPRPDNYAQRGGRAGRRSRVGIVLGYARSTPHDQYFFDKPEEMIAGEVAAPALALGNRDVVLRHIYALAFSSADPGLAGRMAEYVTPQGGIEREKVENLVNAIRIQTHHAVEVALDAFGHEILDEAGLNENVITSSLNRLPERIVDVFERTARQVIELRQALDTFAQDLRGQRAGTQAAELVARLLGIQTDRRRNATEADDRSAGYPLRRFAEFGILPGYEFPTEPATLRLMGDPHEEEPISVVRRFGIGQFQPNAQVFARTRRWRVRGLDVTSPWNPRTAEPSWNYQICRGCSLRFRADQGRCPRCQDDRPNRNLAAFEFGGFLAGRDESPVLEEEERYATRNLVQIYPQWNGDIVGRWSLSEGVSLRLSHQEEVRWLNEGPPPNDADNENHVQVLHENAKGYLLCESCGHILTVPVENQNAAQGRRQPRRTNVNPFGHRDGCPQVARRPDPIAIAATCRTDVLRIIFPLPSAQDGSILSWLLSTGYALEIGMRHLFMLDGAEIEFVYEHPWIARVDESELALASLTFVDPSIGGTGFLERAAEHFHLVARDAATHLIHDGCNNACYRCLKSYTNQRFHEQLSWPLALPTLEGLSADNPTRIPSHVGDIENARDWIEAFSAGVGSPLELKFLRLFERHGFNPEKQVAVAPSSHEPAISIADFAVSASRVAIYVDGASVHVGSRLRRDRYIRDKLRNGRSPWQIVELRASDLRRGIGLVEQLQSLL